VDTEENKTCNLLDINLGYADEHGGIEEQFEGL
jgi:hypothetical protein